MQKLASLRDAGILTDEELEAKKNDILDRMRLSRSHEEDANRAVPRSRRRVGPGQSESSGLLRAIMRDEILPGDFPGESPGDRPGKTARWTANIRSSPTVGDAYSARMNITDDPLYEAAKQTLITMIIVELARRDEPTRQRFIAEVRRQLEEHHRRAAAAAAGPRHEPRPPTPSVPAVRVHVSVAQEREYYADLTRRSLAEGERRAAERAQQNVEHARRRMLRAVTSAVKLKRVEAGLPLPENFDRERQDRDDTEARALLQSELRGKRSPSKRARPVRLRTGRPPGN